MIVVHIACVLEAATIYGYTCDGRGIALLRTQPGFVLVPQIVSWLTIRHDLQCYIHQPFAVYL